MKSITRLKRLTLAFGCSGATCLLCSMVMVAVFAYLWVWYQYMYVAGLSFMLITLIILAIKVDASECEKRCMHWIRRYWLIALVLMCAPVYPIWIYPYPGAPIAAVFPFLAVMYVYMIPLFLIGITGTLGFVLIFVSISGGVKIVEIYQLQEIDGMKSAGRLVLRDLAQKYRKSIQYVKNQLSRWNTFGFFKDGRFTRDPGSNEWEFHYAGLILPYLKKVFDE